MPIIAVGGPRKGVGKTELVCGLIAALPQFRWTAVKITTHHYGQPEPIWEETIAGQGTDTARYLAAGARRAILVTMPESSLSLAKIQAAVGVDTNVLFESNNIVSVLQPDLCLAILDASQADRKPSFEPFVEHADAFVALSESSAMHLSFAFAKPLFKLSELDCISAEMLEWLHDRLNLSQSS